MSNELKKLEQCATFRGRRSFAINDNGTVVASYSGAGRQQELILNLAGINPNMAREKHVAVDMLAATCVFSLIALSMLYGVFRLGVGSRESLLLWGMFVVFLVPTGLCWREYVRKSYDLLVFSEPMTGSQLVLFRSVPDAASVDSFVTALRTGITTAREEALNTSVRTSGMLSHELERLAGLRDKAVLSEAEFQKAKAALLGSLDEKPSIGFHS